MQNQGEKKWPNYQFKEATQQAEIAEKNLYSAGAVVRNNNA